MGGQQFAELPAVLDWQSAELELALETLETSELGRGEQLASVGGCAEAS